MKNIIAALLCISLLVLTVGCAKEPAAPTNEPTIVPTTSVPADTEAAETTLPTQPVAIDAPLLAFSAPIVTKEHRAKDGSLLFTYTSQDISLILEDPQVADAVVIDFLNLIDYENSPAKNILADAESDYSGQSDWVPYSFRTVFSPMRFDAGILSLYGTQALYNGSPRSASANTAVTYDLMTGRPLDLKDVLVEDFSADALSSLICSALSGLETKGMLYSDYAYVISELFSTNKPVDTWYLSTNGLCFYFAPYEIAPYSVGTVTAQIPYAELVGLLKDEYFPAEKIELSGDVQMQPFQNADLSMFTQFAELIIDENGSEYLLHISGCIQNVRIQTGTKLEDESFLSDATIFAAPTLSSSDALMIQLAPDMTQSLLLTYEENDTVVSYDLSALIKSN